MSDALKAAVTNNPPTGTTCSGISITIGMRSMSEGVLKLCANPQFFIANLSNLLFTFSSPTHELVSTVGGKSHSSTYGCQNEGPLPRDAMVWPHACSRAMRRLRDRKKLKRKVICEDKIISVAPKRNSEGSLVVTNQKMERQQTCRNIEWWPIAKDGVIRVANNVWGAEK